MNSFSKCATDNIELINKLVNSAQNFDVLQRKVKIAGKDAGLFFIDGFVQEDMVEKLIQFFYSLK